MIAFSALFSVYPLTYQYEAKAEADSWMGILRKVERVKKTCAIEVEHSSEDLSSGLPDSSFPRLNCFRLTSRLTSCRIIGERITKIIYVIKD